MSTQSSVVPAGGCSGREPRGEQAPAVALLSPWARGRDKLPAQAITHGELTWKAAGTVLEQGTDVTHQPRWA